MDGGAGDARVLIVGGGAAGLMTAIAAARGGARGVTILDGARRLGAKILVSGGSRCNVTNVRVDAADFSGGPRPLVRRVLRAFDAAATVAFFRELGVTLHEEDRGRLFPDSGRARSVLDALLGECERIGVAIRTDHRVAAIAREGGRFRVDTAHGAVRGDVVVLATGGRSLPKSGSDGSGYALGGALGHSIVETTPALVPLVLDGAFHTALAGVSHDVELTVWAEGERPRPVRGSLLWTHFGVSGPAPLDASRHWLRAHLEGRPVRVTMNAAPGLTFEDLESRWLDAAGDRPRQTIGGLLAEVVPAAVAGAMLAACGVARETVLAQLAREARRQVAHAVAAWPLPVVGSRGFTQAEATAGGIHLGEVDVATMASRRCDGLYLVGEVLDVDGRLGGFNFQWAWATGQVAGRAIARNASRGSQQ